MTSLNQLSKTIVADMKANPDQWDFTEYAATNENRGVTVWMANGLYGMDISLLKDRYSSNRDNHIGGVTYLSALFGWTIPWRIRLYRHWKAQRREIQRQKDLKLFGERPRPRNLVDEISQRFPDIKEIENDDSSG